MATIPSEETLKPSSSAAANPRIRLDLRTILYWYLHLFGFTLSSLLISWGLFFLFFLAIGGFSIDGMMHQLANMASRYVAADPARIASFKQGAGRRAASPGRRDHRAAPTSHHSASCV